MGNYLSRYSGLFKVYRRENGSKALQYLHGLFHEGKHNIERMNERIENSDYQQLHHFISVSPWDHEPVLSAVRGDLGKLFENRAELTGLILDESGHRKSGRKSVGVSRQYLGSIGKVDNGQVGVFAALSQGDDVGMVNVRLYLPEAWTKDKKRCKAAKIPPEKQVYKTKSELALEMIREMEGEINYNWIGGDTIYGNSKTLRQGCQDLQRLFVMDVGENLELYLKTPKLYIPPSAPGRGRKRSNYVSDIEPIKAKKLKAELGAYQWKTYKIRPGTKGYLIRQAVVLEVFVWSPKRPTDKRVEKLRLIISRNIDGSEVKYSLTNDIALPKNQHLSDRGALYRQMQRYWVERGFQDCKDTLGLTDYQVRSWQAWYHHITLTIMALHYILEQKVLHENQIPLLSCSDIKFYLALTLPSKAKSQKDLWTLIQQRHKQRQNDLDRYY